MKRDGLLVFCFLFVAIGSTAFSSSAAAQGEVGVSYSIFGCTEAIPGQYFNFFSSAGGYAANNSTATNAYIDCPLVRHDVSSSVPTDADVWVYDGNADTAFTCYFTISDGYSWGGTDVTSNSSTTSADVGTFKIDLNPPYNTLGSTAGTTAKYMIRCLVPKVYVGASSKVYTYAIEE